MESKWSRSHYVGPNKFPGQSGDEGEKRGDVLSFKLDVFLPFPLVNGPSRLPRQQLLPVLVPPFGQWGPRTEIETRTRPGTRFRPPTVVLGEYPLF